MATINSTFVLFQCLICHLPSPFLCLQVSFGRLSFRAQASWASAALPPPCLRSWLPLAILFSAHPAPREVVSFHCLSDVTTSKSSFSLFLPLYFLHTTYWPIPLELNFPRGQMPFLFYSLLSSRSA